MGAKLNARSFYANEHELDGVKVVANIASKNLHIEEDWQGYKYRLDLDLVQISEEDRLKLECLVSTHPRMEALRESSDIISRHPSIEKASLPPLPHFNLATQSPAERKFYDKGKCLKKRAFCDLCNSGDETICVQGTSTNKKSTRGRVTPFTSVLSQWAKNLQSTFRMY